MISAFLQSSWLYNHRHWLEGLPVLSNVGVVLDSLRRVRGVAEKALRSQRRSESNEMRSDIASILMKNQSKWAGEVTEEDVDAMTEHILTFLGAGRETTAVALAWVCLSNVLLLRGAKW